MTILKQKKKSYKSISLKTNIAKPLNYNFKNFTHYMKII